MKPDRQSVFVSLISSAALLFFLIPHTKILDRPLIGLHDMDNGHLLTTVYLWRTEGIAKHNFAPIYSFPPGDINLRTWGLVGRNNRMYHASYPPLSFWLVFLSSYLPGVGISEAAAHLTSLGVFIVALIFLFIYLYATYNLATAIFASGLFSLVPASAYFFGGVIVADIAVFAFWIPAFVLLAFYLRLLKTGGHTGPPLLLAYLFFISLGLAVLTEWLGVLTAFSIFFYLMYLNLKRKFVSIATAKQSVTGPNAKKPGDLFHKTTSCRHGMAPGCLLAPTYLSNFKYQVSSIKYPTIDRGHYKMILGTILVTLLSLLTTATIYLSIATPTNLIQFLTNKYINRGGFISSFTNLAQQNGLEPTWTNGLKIWLNRVMIGYLWPEFTPFFWIIVLISSISIISLSILKKFNQATQPIFDKIIAKTSNDNDLIISVLLIPPLLHIILLNRFHYLHDYSFLSFLPFFTLIAARGFFIITELVEHRANYRWRKLRLFSLTIAGVLLILFYLQAQKAYHFLFVDQTGGWTSTIKLFKATRAKTRPADLILTNHDYYPDRWFYLRRNGLMWVKKQADLNSYSGYFPLFPRVFYVSDYRPFYEAVCGDRPEISVAHGWMCRIK